MKFKTLSTKPSKILLTSASHSLSNPGLLSQPLWVGVLEEEVYRTKSLGFPTKCYTLIFNTMSGEGQYRRLKQSEIHTHSKNKGNDLVWIFWEPSQTNALQHFNPFEFGEDTPSKQKLEKGSWGWIFSGNCFFRGHSSNMIFIQVSSSKILDQSCSRIFVSDTVVLKPRFWWNESRRWVDIHKLGFYPHLVVSKVLGTILNVSQGSLISSSVITSHFHLIQDVWNTPTFQNGAICCYGCVHVSEKKTFFPYLEEKPSWVEALTYLMDWHLLEATNQESTEN